MNGYGCQYLYLSVIRTFLRFFSQRFDLRGQPEVTEGESECLAKIIDNFSFKIRHFCACLYSTVPISSFQCSQGTVGLVQLSPYSPQLGLEFQVFSFQLTGLTAKQLFQSFLSLWWVFGGQSKKKKKSGWYWKKKASLKEWNYWRENIIKQFGIIFCYYFLDNIHCCSEGFEVSKIFFFMYLREVSSDHKGCIIFLNI